ncbi:hypothetical protein WR30_22645 [Burkholderia contaminans FFH2055]|nr:hypothetical protein NL30_05945 [Burkholderia contaminans]AOL06707.1 hypothetical protein WI95_22390 [Burkholderia contaminans]KKL33390.1 hypothetical protein WR30_22645 [Burkholderia contaminans FFH2055]
MGWPPSGSVSGAIVVYDATHARTDAPFVDVPRLPAGRVKAGTSWLAQSRVPFEFDDNEAG